MKLKIDFRAALLAACSLLVVGLWLAQANPYLTAADDSGRYMVLGESLANTGELRLINDVRRQRDTLYVPGLPALIAFWLKITGRDPGGVVLPVKATLLVLLLGTLPLLYILLERAKVRRWTIAAAMVTYATCPALTYYANEVMSEMPLLFLCLASVVLATTTAPDTRQLVYVRPPTAYCLLPTACIVSSITCAVLAYYVRAAGVVLLISLAVWFWHCRHRQWAIATLLITVLVVGTWQMRTSHIIATDPPGTPHDTYMKQFTIKIPEKPDSGRIQANPLGIASRLKRCFLPNIGNIPRAVLFSMSPNGSVWQALFYVLAIPFTLLAFYGMWLTWRRGLVLVCGFSALFWLFIVLWPWINPRFLVPLVPYIVLFMFVGAEAAFDGLETVLPPVLARAGAVAALALLLLYFARVQSVVSADEHAPTIAGYSLGRSAGEAGFYAACAWLKGREPGTVVMARPAYLMHLYSGHPTRQVDPATSPLLQEIAYIGPSHVRYLVVDSWKWARTREYLEPYLRMYASYWTLVWQDLLGSGVRIYRRKDGRVGELSR